MLPFLHTNFFTYTCVSVCRLSIPSIFFTWSLHSWGHCDDKHTERLSHWPWDQRQMKSNAGTEPKRQPPPYATSSWRKDKQKRLTSPWLWHLCHQPREGGHRAKRRRTRMKLRLSEEMGRDLPGALRNPGSAHSHLWALSLWVTTVPSHKPWQVGNAYQSPTPCGVPPDPHDDASPHSSLDGKFSHFSQQHWHCFLWPDRALCIFKLSRKAFY